MASSFDQLSFDHAQVDGTRSHGMSIYFADHWAFNKNVACSGSSQEFFAAKWHAMNRSFKSNSIMLYNPKPRNQNSTPASPNTCASQRKI
jgi:hypothetical protein